jgi:putative membrane protein
MKTKFNFSTRLAITAFTAGAICCATPLFAQEGHGEGSAGAGAQMPKMGSSSSASTPSKTTNSANMSNKSGGQLSNDDKNFIMEAGKGGMMEVEMGKTAQQKGQSADVKRIGSMMVADHTKANNELMGLAQKKGVKLGNAEKAHKMNDAQFDQEYLSMMVQDHQKDIAAFQKEAKSGTDPDVKSWASKTLPTLQKHLKEVQKAQGKVGSAGAKKAS